MRNFSKTLTLMGLLAPVGANALGVGEIKLHSALNQVLEAEIPLITTASEATSDIQVNLASPSAFAKAGIQRPHLLSQLRFKPVNRNGHFIVEVTSKQVIREPFLNFLIDVSWPKGRMLREFTVLLDPPATFKESAVNSTKIPAIRSDTVTKPLYPVDRASNDGLRAKSAMPRKRNESYEPGDFIESKPNDSLWKLAETVNTDPAISREQIMLALYKHNPHAFYKKNMNALMAYQKLTIPSRQVIGQYTPDQAITEFVNHNEAWSSNLSSTGANNNATVSAGRGSPSGKTSSKIESRLKLISPSSGETVAKSSGINGSSSERKAELAIELVETVRQENEELRSRLKDIESQMSRIQRMLTLKSEQLNALQSQDASVADQSEKVIDLESNPITEVVNQDNQSLEAADNSQAPIDESPQFESSDISELGAETPTANEQTIVTNDVSENPEASSASVPPIEEEINREDPISTVPPAETQSDELKTPLQPVPEIAEQVSEITELAPAVSSTEDDLFNELISEPIYLLSGVGGLALLGGLGWTLIRRRNRILEASVESILSPEKSETNPSIAISEPPAENPVQNDSIAVVESSFLSEFTPSDFDALETEHDDVDPVSEADVYLAYGRYQQAEDLIRNAIQNYPERDECKLKLLEIHFATEDRHSFESYAGELENKKQDKPEIWAKIAEMGRQLCPDSSLFISESSDKERTESKHDPVSDDLSDDIPDSFDFGETDLETEPLDFDNDHLGFDLKAESVDQDDSSLEATVAESETQQPDHNDIDLDFQNEALDTKSEEDEFDLSDPHNEPELSKSDDYFLDSLSENDETEDSSSQPLSDSNTSELQFEESELGENDLNFESQPETDVDFEANHLLNDENSEPESNEADFDNDVADKLAIDPEEESDDTVLEAVAVQSDFDLDGQQEDDYPNDEHLISEGNEANLADDDVADDQELNFGYDLEGDDLEDPSLALALGSEEDLESLEFTEADLINSSNDTEDADTDDLSELSDLTDMDEIETKLDLAKAYVEMDDKDSARGILSEIIAEGNEAQKNEAQDLVDILEQNA